MVKILFVDDNEAYRKTLIESLGEKYEIIGLSDPKIALNELSKMEKKPYIIMSDQKMPGGMLGLDFLLKSSSISRNSIRILISSFSDEIGADTIANNLMSHNIDDFIKKTSEMVYIEARFEKAIETFILRRDYEMLSSKYKNLQSRINDLVSMNEVLRIELDKYKQKK